jgi:hypothetical protein
MAENLEQNEVYERELLRTQSSNQGGAGLGVVCVMSS